VFDKAEREAREARAAAVASKASKPMGEKMLKNKDIAAAMAGPVEGDPAAAGMNKKEREQLAADRAKEAYMQRTLAGETEEARRNLEKLALVRKKREEAKAKREAEGKKPGASMEDVAAASTGAKLKSKSKSRSKGSDDSDESSSEEESSSDEETAASKKAKAAEKVAAAKKKDAAKKKKEKAMAAEAADTAEGDDLPKLKSIDIKKMNPAAIKDALKERGQSTQGQKKDLIKRLTDYEAAR